MSNIRLPGFIWVVIIVGSVILLLRFFDAEIVAMIFIPLVFGILKSLKLGTEEENLAIDTIEAIKNNPRIQEAIRSIGFAKASNSPQFRGPSGEVVEGETISNAEMPLVLPATPPRPNKMVRWLAG